MQLTQSFLWLKPVDTIFAIFDEVDFRPACSSLAVDELTRLTLGARRFAIKYIFKVNFA